MIDSHACATLFSGSLLKFLDDCLRARCSWTDCKCRLPDEYFPYLVRERLIRDLNAFKFHVVGKPCTNILRGYPMQIPSYSIRLHSNISLIDFLRILTPLF